MGNRLIKGFDLRAADLRAPLSGRIIIRRYPGLAPWAMIYNRFAVHGENLPQWSCYAFTRPISSIAVNTFFPAARPKVTISSAPADGPPILKTASTRSISRRAIG